MQYTEASVSPYHAAISAAIPAARRASLALLVPFAALTAWYLTVGGLTRLWLWVRFGRELGVSVPALSWILPFGAAMDLLQALYLLAPLALLLWLAPDRWRRSRAMRTVLSYLAAAWFATTAFIAVAEHYFFAEFNSRFNLVAVDYLIYPTEVAGDIWTEYPVIPISLATLALSALATRAIGCHLATACAARTTRLTRSFVFLPYLAVLVLAAATVDTDPLERTDNRIANELAANGISRFIQALRTSELDYHAHYASHAPARNLELLRREFAAAGSRFTRLDERRLDRSFPARPDGLGRLNVILVTSESFGAEFSRLYGSERHWTPEFDALAERGLWFRHVYASGTRTVRGLEAISASIPPIPTVSILRRPGYDRVATLGEVLEANGYHATFMYGGYGYFDNMNAFFAANGYEIVDRTDLTAKPRFENIWGVADEDLFDAVIAHADRLSTRRKPFFIHVMTTSNHKPFTFRTGLESRGIRSEGGGRESGVRYADYAQGRFMRMAATRRWFEDTLFVIVADHGARVYGREDIPMRSYEIPLLFYAPRHLPPRRIDVLTSQIDIAPTLLGLLGLPYTAPWFGRDVLHEHERAPVAFFNHNHDVALYRNGTLAVLGLHGRVSDFTYSPLDDRYSPARPDPALNALAVAYFQTAYELFRTGRYE